MKLIFIRGAEQGQVEYDESTDTYSWSYDGQDQKIIDILSECDDGRAFTEIHAEEDDPGGEGPAVMNEWYELMDWEGQLKKIQKILRQNDFKVKYFE